MDELIPQPQYQRITNLDEAVIRNRIAATVKCGRTIYCPDSAGPFEIRECADWQAWLRKQREHHLRMRGGR